MENSILQTIQTGLLEKRRNLMNWLRQTPEATRSIQLGPEKEGAMLAQIDTIDSALAKVEDKSIGQCEICCEDVEESLLKMDYTSCVCLSHFSDREKMQLESELELVQVIQKAFLPQQIPEIPGLDLAIFSRPAQIVSGDYFDFFKFHNGTHGFVVADAMGHGVSASLIMSALQSSLRTIIPESDSSIEVLKRVNRAFLHNIRFTTFVTVVLCQYDSHNRILSFVNAGHNPPLVFHKHASVISELYPTGAAIGLAESYDLSAGKISLQEGDVVLFYTDGVTDATNSSNEAFGAERLGDLIKQNALSDAQNLLRIIREALFEFVDGKPLEDDITLLACKGTI